MIIKRNNRTQRDCKQPQKHKMSTKIQKNTKRHKTNTETTTKNEKSPIKLKQPQTHTMTSECGSSHSQRSERTRSGPSQVRTFSGQWFSELQGDTS